MRKHAEYCLLVVGGMALISSGLLVAPSFQEPKAAKEVRKLGIDDLISAASDLGLDVSTYGKPGECYRRLKVYDLETNPERRCQPGLSGCLVVVEMGSDGEARVRTYDAKADCWHEGKFWMQGDRRLAARLLGGSERPIKN